MYRGKLKQKVGVVLFVDGSFTSAWVCRGEERSYYIANPNELDRNTYWVGNVSSVTSARLRSQYGYLIFPSNYLSVELDELIEELSLANRALHKQANVLAKILSSVCEFYTLYTGSENLPTNSLALGVFNYSGLNPVPHPRSISELVDEDKEAFIRLPLEHWDSLTFHRFDYATSLLRGSIPAGRWKDVSHLVTNKSASQFATWVSQLNKPALIRASFDYPVPVGEHHLNVFYSGACWITAEEFMILSKSFEFTISNVLLSEASGFNPVTVPKWGKLTENSYSFGIFCQALWASFIAREDANPISLWMHCKNRMNCYLKAKEIEESSRVRVVGYGFGKLYLPSEIEGRGFCADLAARHNLVSNLTVERPHSDRRISQNPTNTELLQIAMERGALEFLQDTDEAAVSKAIDSMETETSLIYQRPRNGFLI